MPNRWITAAFRSAAAHGPVAARRHEGLAPHPGRIPSGADGVPQPGSTLSSGRFR